MEVERCRQATMRLSVSVWRCDCQAAYSRWTFPASRWLLSVLVLSTLICLAAVPATAAAAQYTVNSIGDQADLAADGSCSTVAGKCSLRAAIEEANAAIAGGDEIAFHAGVFDGESDSTIVLGSNLPAVAKPVAIDGGRCETEAGADGPCVAIDGTNSGPGLKIEADGATVEGIAFFDTATGIKLLTADAFMISGNWFGVKLDGGLLDAGNGTAVLVGPDSDNGVIGGEEPEAGNLFVHGVDGLELLGASENEVLGNRFGFAPDGTAVDWGRFGRAVTVVSAPLAGLEAVGNVIGTQPDPGEAATPACDGGCNLIAQAGYAIVLDWEGEQRAPAVETTIVGNQIGIDPSGTEAVGSRDGIVAGLAQDTVVGGLGLGEGNRINGGGSAIRGGGRNLMIAGNSIGLNADGSEILAPPLDSIRVFSEGLEDPGEEAIVVGNEIGLDGGRGIEQDGLGATLVANEIFGAEIGILTSQANNGHGSLIEANLIEGSRTGVMIENDFNELYGNGIFESSNSGVAIFGRNGLEATGNVIGGDAPEDENVFAFNGGNAIVIGGVEGSQNEVARNNGFFNEEGFIRLLTYSPHLEPVGPNGGIEPPEFITATAERAAGTAEPGARVRVFRKQSVEPGEIESFLGEAVADSGGEWSVDYGLTLPGGTPVAATQTNVEGGTSELEFATTAAKSDRGGGEGEGDAGGGGTPEQASVGVPAPVPSAAPIALPRGRVFVRGGRVLVRVICRRGPCGTVLKVFTRVPVAGVRKARGSRRAARRRARLVLIGKRRLRVGAGARPVLRIPLNRRGRVLVRRAGRRGLKVRLGGRGVRSRAARLRRFGGKAQRRRVSTRETISRAWPRSGHQGI